LAGLFVAATWLPLLLLCLPDEAVRRAFWRDLVLHARLWISGPVLILLQPLVTSRLRPVSRHLVDSGTVPELEWQRLARVHQRLARLRDSAAVPLLLAIVALSISLIEPVYPLPLWRHAAGPGLWFGWVSGPLVRWLLLLWVWWVCLWGLYVLQVSRLRLHLVMTHPDGRGGLSPLGDALTSFGWLTFAVGVPVAAQAKLILGRPSGATLTGYLLPLALVGASAALLLYAPLLAFAGPLRRAKRRASLEFAVLAGRQAEAFQRHWFGRGEERGVLQAPDFSSVEDLQSVFERTRASEWIPFRVKPVAVVAAGALWAAVPFLLADRELAAVLLKILRALG